MRPISFIIVGLSFFFQSVCFPQSASEQMIIAEVDSALAKLLSLHKTIRALHPYLEPLHPIAIVEQDHLFIFDFDSSQAIYRFNKKTPVPFPMPPKIRASFPLSSYDGKPSCVVTRDIFDSLNGYILLFHEFVHCSQANTLEYVLKNKLKIVQIATQNQNYSWELNHPFAYQDSAFVQDYSGFLEAMEKSDDIGVSEYRSRLRRNLSQVDFEYMVWEEWKEGFARFIENRLQSQNGLNKNKYGKEQPFNRVTFYYGGARFIRYLVHGEAELFLDPESLFDRMFRFPDEK